MRRKVNNPQELERALDGFIAEHGGSKELVTYLITPSKIYKGKQLYDCKEIHSIDITPKKEKK
jgi:hypothetical protein